MQSSKRRAAGFTIVELVAVILVLGILAAVALPKFVNVGKDARIASVNALYGSIKSTAALLQMKCAVDTNGCNVNAQMTSLTYNGTTYGMNYGWIGAGFMSPGLIDSAIDYSGFTVSASNPYTTFSVPSAPTPSNCSVTYGNAWGSGSYSLAMQTSGC